MWLRLLGAVNWCLGAWPRTPEPRDGLGIPSTLARAGKGEGGMRAGVGHEVLWYSAEGHAASLAILSWHRKES